MIKQFAFVKGIFAESDRWPAQQSPMKEDDKIDHVLLLQMDYQKFNSGMDKIDRTRDVVLHIDCNATTMSVSIPTNKGILLNEQFMIKNGIVKPGLTQCDEVGV